MAISYSVESHTYMNPGNLIAENYGEHMVSLDITDMGDTDNGTIVKVGKMKSLDLWAPEKATTIDAYIALQGADGTWLVVINSTEDDKTAVIYQKPLINEESPKKLTDLKNFYNDPTDGAVRGYILHSLDRFWLDADGFVGTPAKDAKITTITDGKLVIA